MPPFNLRPGTYHITVSGSNTNISPWIAQASQIYSQAPQVVHTRTARGRRKLAVVQDDTPIMAHRFAELRGTVDLTRAQWVERIKQGGVLVPPGRRFQLASVTGERHPFATDGLARCRNAAASGLCQCTTCRRARAGGGIVTYPPEYPTHSAPDPSCTCGWYALPLGVPAPNYSPTTHYVDLLVELSGRVIEHETGYRAQHQRVLEVHVRPCHCGSLDVTHVIMRNTELNRSVCGRCLRSLKREKVQTDHVSLDEISRQLEAPVLAQELH